jgi:hypothetical protein
VGSVLLGLRCSGLTLLSGLRDHAPVRSGWLVSVSEHRFRRRLRPRPRADLGVAPAATTIVSGGILTVVYLWRQDYPCLDPCPYRDGSLRDRAGTISRTRWSKLTDALPRASVSITCPMTAGRDGCRAGDQCSEQRFLHSGLRRPRQHLHRAVALGQVTRRRCRTWCRPLFVFRSLVPLLQVGRLAARPKKTTNVQRTLNTFVR